MKEHEKEHEKGHEREHKIERPFIKDSFRRGAAAAMTFIGSAAALMGPFLLRGTLFIACALLTLAILLAGCILLFSMPYALLVLFLVAVLF